jgi:hypothetical protein
MLASLNCMMDGWCLVTGIWDVIKDVARKNISNGESRVDEP